MSVERFNGQQTTYQSFCRMIFNIRSKFIIRIICSIELNEFVPQFNNKINETLLKYNDQLGSQPNHSRYIIIQVRRLPNNLQLTKSVKIYYYSSEART